MKRLFVVISSLLILPAFAEIAPSYYDDAVEYTDADIIDTGDAEIVSETADVAEENVAPTAAAPVTGGRTSGRVAASRATASGGMRSTRTNVTNGNSNRNLSPRSGNTAGANVARSVSSRAGVTRAGVTQNAHVNTPAAKTTSATPTRSTGALTARAAAPATRASITQTNTATQPLYNANRVSSRVPTIRMAGANMSTSTTSASTSATTTQEKANAVSDMDDLAQMTDYCKAQYVQCMDNFCNVLDDNQGRCSCSKNIVNYAKTEAALKKATEDLQDVAQKIQYIGLSADDIETLFSQTEAELKMQNTTDNTQLKNDLDKIKKLIVEVKPASASSTESGLSLDFSGLLDFSFSSTGFDLASLFGGGSNTSSISNQRGEQLYKTAAARCKAAVLNTCSAQGVDVTVITNSYDLEIDKQCIAYERALTDSNNEMSLTVRNAKNVLQKARLLVAQQKNQYDLRGCINALDSCMQDDFVCGSDYENCLDPTGKYIVNGDIVVGSTPGIPGGQSGVVPTDGLYKAWNYTVGSGNDAVNKNAFIAGDVPSYVDGTIYKATTDFNNVPTTISEYLQNKIGYADSNGKSYGMCMSVLNKCQNLTYGCKGSAKSCAASEKVYKPDNEVVRNYLERVSLTIKSAQDNTLTDYAEGCISDVSSCLSQNSYSYLSTNVTTTDSVSVVAVSACRSVINSCMSATGYDVNIPEKMFNWLQTTLGVTVTGTYVSSVKDVQNATACVALRGTWNASGTQKCSCSASNNVEEKYGMCVCKEHSNPAKVYEWDESQSKCVEKDKAS